MPVSAIADTKQWLTRLPSGMMLDPSRAPTVKFAVPLWMLARAGVPSLRARPSGSVRSESYTLMVVAPPVPLQEKAAKNHSSAAMLLVLVSSSK